MIQTIDTKYGQIQWNESEQTIRIFNMTFAVELFKDLPLFEIGQHYEIVQKAIDPSGEITLGIIKI